MNAWRRSKSTAWGLLLSVLLLCSCAAPSSQTASEAQPQQSNSESSKAEVHAPVTGYDAQQLEYSYSPATRRSSVAFTNLREIPEFTAENSGWAYRDERKQTLHLFCEIVVGENTGAPGGPKMECVIDLANQQVLSIDTERYSGEGSQAGENWDFPGLTNERLLEIAAFFQSIIDEYS